MAFEGRCGSCAAFTRVRNDPQHGRIGECALHVFPPPVRATSTCSRYRPKGAEGAAPQQRAAGQPRARTSAPSPRPRDDRPAAPDRARPPLPQEIDIDMDINDFRRVLRDVLSEELGIGDAEIAGRWDGGELVLKPGKAGTQEKRIPIETFFKKIVMVRDRLRVLEAKLNAHEGLTAGDKVQLQSYITGCYGSLTTFNLLFSHREDAFSGAGEGGGEG